MNEEEKNAVEYSKNCLMKIAFGIDCEFDVNILEKLINLIDKLQEENEELKFKERSRVIGKYGDIEIHDLINKIISNDYISVQKVKDEIDRIDYDIKKTKEIISNNSNIYTSDRRNDYQIVRLKAMNTKSLDIKKRLQELLEGRK